MHMLILPVPHNSVKRLSDGEISPSDKKSTHPGGFEPPLPPPEGGALSPELRVHKKAL